MKKIFLAFITTIFAFQATLQAKDDFKIAWSHYTGWELMAYLEAFKIIDKHAKENKITIKVDLINDYVNSIELFTSGEYDAVTVTNMDALAFPSVGGIDTSFRILGDTSHGNDALVVKGYDSIKDLKSQEVYLVELSVSHYFFVRMLEMNGMKEKDVTIVNTSDAQIGALFTSQKKVAVVTWNPIVQAIKSQPGAKILADSADIPGEIIDGVVTRTDSDTRFNKALVGAWYEGISIMSGKQGEEKKKECIEFMAEKAGGTLAEFEAQLKTTKMFYDPKDAVKFSKGKEIQKTMEFVRTFAFDHGLYGDGAPSKNLVGIKFPDGKVQGDKNNIKLRFDSTYMESASK